MNELYFDPLNSIMGRNIAHSFWQTRSEVSLKYTIVLIIVAMNNIFHIVKLLFIVPKCGAIVRLQLHDRCVCVRTCVWHAYMCACL